MAQEAYSYETFLIALHLALRQSGDAKIVVRGA